MQYPISNRNMQKNKHGKGRNSRAMCEKDRETSESVVVCVWCAWKVWIKIGRLYGCITAHNVRTTTSVSHTIQYPSIRRATQTHDDFPMLSLRTHTLSKTFYQNEKDHEISWLIICLRQYVCFPFENSFILVKCLILLSFILLSSVWLNEKEMKKNHTHSSIFSQNSLNCTWKFIYISAPKTRWLFDFVL